MVGKELGPPCPGSRSRVEAHVYLRFQGQTRQIYLPLDTTVGSLASEVGCTIGFKAGATYLTDPSRTLASYCLTSGATLEWTGGGLRGGAPSLLRRMASSGRLRSGKHRDAAEAAVADDVWLEVPASGSAAGSTVPAGVQYPSAPQLVGGVELGAAAQVHVSCWSGASQSSRGYLPPRRWTWPPRRRILLTRRWRCRFLATGYELYPPLV